MVLLNALYHDFAAFALIYSSWLEYLMNKLKGDCFIGHDTSILLYKYSWIYK